MTEPEDPAPPDGGVPGLVDHLFRRQAGQVVAMLTRIFGVQYLDLAEDVAQDTLLKALRQWSYRGVPDNPAGWIMRVARNGALDALRREASLREKQAEIAAALEAPWAARPRSRRRRSTARSPTTSYACSSRAATRRSHARRAWR